MVEDRYIRNFPFRPLPISKWRFFGVCSQKNFAGILPNPCGQSVFEKSLRGVEAIWHEPLEQVLHDDKGCRTWGGKKNFRRISLPFPTIPPVKKTLQ